LYLWVSACLGCGCWGQGRAPEEILFELLNASLTSFSGNGRSKFRKKFTEIREDGLLSVFGGRVALGRVERANSQSDCAATDDLPLIAQSGSAATNGASAKYAKERQSSEFQC